MAAPTNPADYWQQLRNHPNERTKSPAAWHLPLGDPQDSSSMSTGDPDWTKLTATSDSDRPTQPESE